MYQIVTETDLTQQTRMEAFAEGHPKGHFLQSPRWRGVKAQWGWRGVLAYDEAGQIRGSLSILSRRLPGGTALLYAPRGPVCDPEDVTTMETLFRGAREVARKERACMLKLDPDIPESDSAFCARLKELGFHPAKQSLNFEGIQPRFVFRLPLAGRTEDEVLAGFEGRTRYKIRLARRRGVEIRWWQGSEPIPDRALDSFDRLMRETGTRDGFLVRNKAYFGTLLGAMGEHVRLYLALLEGEAVAGTIAMQYGDKTWYLYGASSARHREAMPNYLLQWEMIRWALGGGSRFYDFRGVSGDLSPDNPLYGLYRFKKGFRGELCAFAGEFTLVYRPWMAWGVNLAKRGYDTLRRVRRPGRKGGRPAE